MKYLAVVGVAAACGSSPPPPSSQPYVEPVQLRATPQGEPSEPAPVEVRVVAVDALPVVRFVRNTLVRAEPDSGAPDIGTIARNARTAVIGEAPAGAGCATRWLQLSPRGWACDTATVSTDLLPSVAVPASLTDDDPTPPVTGVYGIVRKQASAFDSIAAITAGESQALVGNNSVRAVGAVRIDGRRYWRTSGGQLIDEASIVGMSPSRFRGVGIDDPEHMPAWVRSAERPISARAQPSRRAKIARKLKPRTVVNILSVSDDGRFMEIDLPPHSLSGSAVHPGAAGVIDLPPHSLNGSAVHPGAAGVIDLPPHSHVWVDRSDLRIAERRAAPEGIGDDDKWFDVDLDAQVLVAYQGTRPVYATLVSTGRWGHATPEIITRVAHKLQRTTMASDQVATSGSNGEGSTTEVYSVADVPWTMFYDRDYALHAAYWHDGFGSPRSHGCVNLAPYDARLLFRWSSPDVPPGWIAVRGDVDHPGSLVRIRSRRVPEPIVRGYARQVRGYAREVRQRSTTDG